MFLMATKNVQEREMRSMCMKCSIIFLYVKYTYQFVFLVCLYVPLFLRNYSTNFSETLHGDSLYILVLGRTQKYRTSNCFEPYKSNFELDITASRI